MVGDVVRCVAHPKQRAGGVEVARHAGPHVDILPDALSKTAKRLRHHECVVFMHVFKLKDKPARFSGLIDKTGDLEMFV